MGVVIQEGIPADNITNYVQYKVMEDLKNQTIGSRDTNDDYIDEEVIDGELVNQSKCRGFLQTLSINHIFIMDTILRMLKASSHRACYCCETAILM